jgi:hypothetical protein
MEALIICPALLELAKVGIAFLSVILSLLAAYLVYRLGLRAYFKQKEYENVRKRYLEDGIELICSQIDYALGVYRHNWMLLLRILKQYRENERQLSVEDFYDSFIELDQAYFQITPMYKVQVLLQDRVLWVAYQDVFSFVGNANNKIKADFGDALKAMLEVPEHPNKVAFVDRSTLLANETEEEAEKIYLLLGQLQDIAEILEREKLTRRAISAFADRKEAKNVVQALRKIFPSDASQVALAGASAGASSDTSDDPEPASSGQPGS